AGFDFEIHIAQNGQAVGLGLAIGKTHVLKAHALTKWRKRCGSRLVFDFVFFIHEAEHLLRSSQGLLEVVVEESELADRIVQAKDSDDEADESALGHRAAPYLAAANP